MTIKNINAAFGDLIEFDSVTDMADAIRACGYQVPDDGLKEGRDYENIMSAADIKSIGAVDAMIYLDKMSFEKEHDWESGSTTWQLPDGKKVIISGPDIEIEEA